MTTNEKSTELAHVDVAFPVNVPAKQWESSKEDVLSFVQKMDSGKYKVHVLGAVNDDVLLSKLLDRDPAYMDYRGDMDRADRWWGIPLINNSMLGAAVIGFFSIIAGIVGAIVGLNGNPTGFEVTGWALLATTAPATLLFLFNRVYVLTGPKRLTAKEHAKSKKAITNIHLAKISRTSHYHKMQSVAAFTVENISRNRAYQSSRFDVSRVRIDLTEELRQIAKSCALLEDMSRELSKIRVDGWQDMSVKDSIKEYQRQLTSAEDAVLNRVTALVIYSNKLKEVEHLIISLEKEMKVVDAMFSSGAKFSESYALITGNNDAAVNTLKLTVDAEDLKQRIEAELKFIRENIIEADGSSMMTLEVSHA